MNRKPTVRTMPAGTNALYRAVWRWHLIAGLCVAPFVVFLALTGSIYLWKPQYEAWRYRKLFNVTVPTKAVALSADAQFAAARADLPSLPPVQFIPAFRPDASSAVQFGAASGPKMITVFINPYTGAVLGRINEATRFMRIIHDLHGELLIGAPGAIIIELAASWTFVLLVTGLFLWWPRPFTVRGFLLPRLGSGRRALLRDLHAVPAVWLSLILLFLLVTGIQWTKVGGAWTRTLAQVAGEWTPPETQASAHRSELLGGWSPPLADKALSDRLARVASQPPRSDPHAGHRRIAAAWRDDPNRISLDRVMAIAHERRVTDDYAIALPNGPTGVYSILTDRNHAFSRVYLHLDQYSGKVLAAVRFKDFGAIGKFYMFGIIAHEGQLFGLANQLLGLVACLGVILLACTGVAMWWSRRPADNTTPPTRPLFQISKGAVIIAVVLSALLPLMAASLLVMWLTDRLFMRRFLTKRLRTGNAA
jgi:uncharacterized iron-regulated membrane protein